MKTVLFVRLGVAYYNQGFINIRKEGDEYFGNHNETVTVLLNGKSGVQKIDARIDRIANTNNTPRLMMGTTYRDWVQSNCKMGEKLIVKVLDKNEIMLTRQPTTST